MNILNKSFYFLRHGETDYNKRNLYMGSLDVPLNQFGRQQASIAAKILKDHQIDNIVASPLSRARTTAEIVAKELGKEIIFIDELKECIVGIEGLAICSNSIKDWFDGKPSNVPETIEEFEARILVGFQKSLSLNGVTLIVSHGGVCAALRRILKLPPIHIRNCMAIYHRPPKSLTDMWYGEIIE